MSRPLHLLRKLAALPAAERMDLLLAQGALLHAQARALMLPRGRLVRVSPERERAVAPDARAQAEAERAARAVARVASFGLFRPACLVRSLALAAMLERRGVRGSAVRVGVRRAADGLEAHAWVELGGRPLGERDEVVRSLVPLPTASMVGHA